MNEKLTVVSGHKLKGLSHLGNNSLMNHFLHASDNTGQFPSPILTARNEEPMEKEEFPRREELPEDNLSMRTKRLNTL